MKLNVIFSITAILLLSSCNLASKYKKPEAQISQNWPISIDSKDFEKSVHEISWQNFFKNKELQEIITIALENNKDLTVAALNIEKSYELYRISKSDSWFKINSSASFTRQRTPKNSLIGFGGNFASSSRSFIIDNYRANLAEASFELDLFGKLKNANKSAFEDFLSQIEAKNTVKIALIAQTANAYLQWICDLEKINLIKKKVANQEKNLELMQKIYAVGMASKIDISEAQSEIHLAKSELAQIEKITQQDKNILILLMGQENDEKIKAIELAKFKVEENFKTPLPSEVLLMRPDIQKSEHDLIAQNANIGAARAAFFPSISITGSYGFASTKFSTLFSSGSRGAWSYTPKVTLPIFAGGQISANLKAEKVQEKIALENYQKAVQTAFKEVSDELINKKYLKEQLELAILNKDSRKKIFEIHQELVKNGSENLFNTILNENEFLSAKNDALEIKKQYLMNQINLYKVFGGGLF
jgi:multidrug efflux system outer membrane protein